jgi:hypothetical protein
VKLRLRNCLAHNIVAACVLISIGIVGASTQGRTGEPRPDAEGSAGVLVADHGCWTGQAPADVIAPGGVVVQIRHEVAPRYSAKPRMITRAITKALGDAEDPNLKVIAFCR